MPDRYDLPQRLQGLTLRNAIQLDHETFRTDVVILLDAVERVLPTLAQKTAEPTVGTDDRIIDRVRTDRGRSASQGIARSRRRWIACLAGSTGLDTTADQLLTEGDGHRWPRSRKLLAGVMAIVLSVSGILLAMLSDRSTPTTIVLTTSPLYPLAQGSRVTLTASITPSSAAGTVQFKDGTTNIGNLVTVSNNGTASGSTSMLSVGSHQLTAVFTPNDPVAFGPSISPAVNFTVTTQG